MEKVKCYIAGKLDADACNYIQNMHRMIKTARKIRKLDIAVYVPCLDFLEGLVDGKFAYGDYFNNSQPWLLSSDFVFVCDNWKTSQGTKREIELATENDIPVFFSIDKLKKAMKNGF